MSEHHATISWKRTSKGFAYAEYNREHEWIFAGGASVEATAALQFLGNGQGVDPEEAFVASISACHMLTFLAICARKRIVVDSYTDEAVGYLAENNEGKLAVIRVELSPRIGFAGSKPDSQDLARVHQMSHEECFIANSVNTEIQLTRHA